jgi:endonuclease G
MSTQQRRDDEGSSPIRRDVLVSSDSSVAAAVRAAMKSLRARLAPKVGARRRRERLSIRKLLLEPGSGDPNGFERVIGRSDFQSVNFLARGMRAAAAVCRIRVPALGGEWYGSGFLVGPRLLLTNNHVLAGPEDAAQAEAEFGYEHDLDGVLKPAIQFNLAPHELFFTDVEHDVTFVAVTPFSEGGVPLERYGYLPLLGVSGKAVPGEWVTVIQHPGGQPKQLTIRANQVIELESKGKAGARSNELFIHYTTDTEPGSSGSPVLNDQWQVVAIHHKAIPKSLPGRAADGTLEFDKVEWIANEGVRVSAAIALLERARLTDKSAAAALERLNRAIGLSPLLTGERQAPSLRVAEKEGSAFALSEWKAHGEGYDPDFLDTSIPFTDILGARRTEAAPLLAGGSVELKYLHFSTIIHKKRGFPMLTAVNINGSRLVHPGKNSCTWRRDCRLDQNLQPGDNFYAKSEGDDKVQFDRGHMVRRMDPCWGTPADARTAEQHTFHFTNAAPQVHKYNDADWGNLEDYVLDRVQTKEKRCTVFTGPVFRDSDPFYGASRKGGPWQIPITFWKIAVIEKGGGEYAAAAFMIGQLDYVRALLEARVFSGLKPYSYEELLSRMIQTTIAAVEQETGFDFSAIRKYDVQGALETTRQVRFIRSGSDILL